MKLRNLLLLSLACSLSTANMMGQVSFGSAKKINSDWRFTLSNPSEAHIEKFNDSGWQEVNLPHDWSVKEQLSPSLASCTGFLPGGMGWYRKNLFVPADAKGKKMYIYFEGVYNRSEVYVNGHSVGKRPNGYVSFMYDITPHLKYGEENVVSVKVDHEQSADSRWYTGSGIYRNVFLIEANPIHIAQWGVHAQPKSVSKKQATLSVEVELDNTTAVSANLVVNNELVTPDGKVIAKNSQKLTVGANNKNKLKTELKVSNPTLWDLNNPALYQLKTTVLKDGKVIDESTTKTGFRTYTFDPNKGFALNGEWMKMKGVCLHHDAGVLGSAVPKDVWRRRLQTLKEVGCNAIRTSHNPQSPDLYELCDELGLLVMNEAFDEWEFPKRKWLTGWNVGTPGFQGAYDYFEEWGERDLADMVRRDRNHISIFAWSIGNEVDYPNDPYSHPVLDGKTENGFTQAMFGGYRKDAPDAMRLGGIAKRLAKVVREYDSRPVTAGLAGVAMSNETEYPGALDIAGYNYTEGLYDSDHQKYPNRVIYGSENRHELGAWKYVRDKEFVFGQFLWTGIDYLGESGKWPSRGFYSGLLDFGGNIKPRGYYRQSLWANTPVAYLGSYPTPGKNSKNQMRDVWSSLDAENEGSNYVERVPSMDAWPLWNYTQGEMIRVVCYTNAQKARLELNGKEIGAVKLYDDNTGIIYWDVPYTAGKLEVVGLNDKNIETVRHSIQTSKKPHALSIVSKDKSVCKENGLVQIKLQVVDEDGVPVMISEDEITCHIAGPGRLLGLEASNNSDMGDYTDNKQRAFNGHLLAYIQPTGKEGSIKVKFTAPWLKEVVTEVIVK